MGRARTLGRLEVRAAPSGKGRLLAVPWWPPVDALASAAGSESVWIDGIDRSHHHPPNPSPHQEASTSTMQQHQHQYHPEAKQDHFYHNSNPNPSIECRRALLHGAPVVLLRGDLPDGMAAWLLEGSGPALARDLGVEGAEGTGFDACVDHPAVPGHRYWECCCHGAIDLPGPLGGVFHPRHLKPSPLPPAPTPLRAFATCMRRTLESRWYRPWLRPRLLQLLTAYETTEIGGGGDGIVRLGEGLRALVGALDGGGMFRSLAVQVHAGDGVEDPALLNWHKDWPNSLLHLAFGLGHGRPRTLHAHLSAPFPSPAEAIDAPPDSTTVTMVTPQPPGAVYLTSPTLFTHAVAYPPALEWRDRVIAVQCRLALTEAEHHALVGSRLERDARFVGLWAEGLLELGRVGGWGVGGLLPSVEEVRQAVDER